MQQFRNWGFGNYIACKIVDRLFHTCCLANTIDIAKIVDSNEIPLDRNVPIKMLLKQIEDAHFFTLIQLALFQNVCIKQYH